MVNAENGVESFGFLKIIVKSRRQLVEQHNLWQRHTVSVNCYPAVVVVESHAGAVLDSEVISLIRVRETLQTRHRVVVVHKFGYFAGNFVPEVGVITRGRHNPHSAS